jgi:hypothetical protein
MFTKHLGLIHVRYDVNGWYILHGESRQSKAIPVTGHGGLWSCEILRILHYLGNRLIDGGEVVSLNRRSRSTPHKLPSASDAHFF